MARDELWTRPWRKPSLPHRSSQGEKYEVHALAESFTNPFDIGEHDKLAMLSSGATVPSDIEKDVLRAGAARKSHKEAYLFSERLEAKEHFFVPVKKFQLETMADTHRKVTRKST